MQRMLFPSQRWKDFKAQLDLVSIDSSMAAGLKRDLSYDIDGCNQAEGGVLSDPIYGAADSML